MADAEGLLAVPSPYLTWPTALNAYFSSTGSARPGSCQHLHGRDGYTLIGGRVVNFHAPNEMPYFLYLLVGLMGWQLFLSTLAISARSFLRLRSLLRDVHFPLILVPIAGSARPVRFFLLFTTYVIAITYYWIPDGNFYAQLPPKYVSSRRRACCSASPSPGVSASGPRR